MGHNSQGVIHSLILFVLQRLELIFTRTVYLYTCTPAKVRSNLKSSKVQAPVVQKLDSTIYWINLYPVDNAIGFPNIYPLDSDLSGG